MKKSICYSFSLFLVSFLLVAPGIKISQAQETSSATTQEEPTANEKWLADSLAACLAALVLAYSSPQEETNYFCEAIDGISDIDESSSSSASSDSSLPQ